MVRVLSPDVLKPPKAHVYPTEQMTDRLDLIKSRGYLAALGESKGLGNHLLLNPCQGGQIMPRTMAAAVAALIGAVLLDSELDITVVKAVMIRLGIMDAETEE